MSDLTVEPRGDSRRCRRENAAAVDPADQLAVDDGSGGQLLVDRHADVGEAGVERLRVFTSTALSSLATAIKSVPYFGDYPHGAYWSADVPRDEDESYARLRFLPDPVHAGQLEIEIEIDADVPFEHERLRAALEVLRQHARASDDCYFCLWDGRVFVRNLRHSVDVTRSRAAPLFALLVGNRAGRYCPRDPSCTAARSWPENTRPHRDSVRIGLRGAVCRRCGCPTDCPITPVLWVLLVPLRRNYGMQNAR